ncbi:MAG: sulfotransferase [Chromatiales bacterium]|nr:sulfotransferase [Chromatiales bacterium]
MSTGTKSEYSLSLIEEIEEEYFSKLHTIVLTIGFHRSGSSLVGYLLTAHPNIVMGHEPNIRKYHSDLKLLLFRVLYVDRDRFTRAEAKQKIGINKIVLPAYEVQPHTANHAERYVLVPNQWQNRCESLEVLGIKQSYSTVQLFNDKKTFKEFTKAVEKRGISLKFIFTVRNPYDMIVPKKRTLNDQITTYEKHAPICKDLLSRIQTESVFMNKHEDMVANPKDQLTKLCHFLKVEADQNYLNDCVSAVCPTPRENRYKSDWSAEQKERVAKLIEHYDFFSGYSWAS